MARHRARGCRLLLALALVLVAAGVAPAVGGAAVQVEHALHLEEHFRELDGTLRHTIGKIERSSYPVRGEHYAAGTIVSLTLAPLRGAIFEGWVVNGQQLPPTTSLELVMDRDLDVIAMFRADPGPPGTLNLRYSQVGFGLASFGGTRIGPVPTRSDPPGGEQSAPANEAPGLIRHGNLKVSTSRIVNADTSGYRELVSDVTLVELLIDRVTANRVTARAQVGLPAPPAGGPIDPRLFVQFDQLKVGGVLVPPDVAPNTVFPFVTPQGNPGTATVRETSERTEDVLQIQAAATRQTRTVNALHVRVPVQDIDIVIASVTIEMVVPDAQPSPAPPSPSPAPPSPSPLPSAPTATTPPSPAPSMSPVAPPSPRPSARPTAVPPMPGLPPTGGGGGAGRASATIVVACLLALGLAGLLLRRRRRAAR